MSLGAAGVIDGMAAFFPCTVVRLFNLTIEREYSSAVLKEIGELQWAVSSCEEMVGKYGIVGIKEAIHRILGLGTLEGSRLPLVGSMGEGEWEKWSGIVGHMTSLEKKYSS